MKEFEASYKNSISFHSFAKAMTLQFGKGVQVS